MTPRHLALAAIALLLDGVLTSTEGWAMRRGHAWGRWLVVLATGGLLPFDVVVSVRHPSWVELGGTAFNLLVVIYLARRALRAETRREKNARTAGVRPGR